MVNNGVFGGSMSGIRGRQLIFRDDFARETITPTGWPTLYTFAEVGASGAPGLDTNVNRIFLTTDSTGAGDNQDMRLASLRIERNYTSLITGMQLEMQTSQVQLDLPFSLTAATDTEAFIGLVTTTGSIAAAPTTGRHIGMYVDISAGANFVLTSANGTTQVTTDTTIPVDTAAHILRMTWTGEDAATLQLLSAAGAVQGTSQTVAAFNGTTGNSYVLHWFVETEAAAAKTMRVYPYSIKWT